MKALDPALLADLKQNFDHEADAMNPSFLTKDQVVNSPSVLLDVRNFDLVGTTLKAVKAGLIKKWGRHDGTTFYALTAKGFDALFPLHADPADKGWGWNTNGGGWKKL